MNLQFNNRLLATLWALGPLIGHITPSKKSLNTPFRKERWKYSLGNFFSGCISSFLASTLRKMCVIRIEKIIKCSSLHSVYLFPVSFLTKMYKIYLSLIVFVSYGISSPYKFTCKNCVYIFLQQGT